MIKLAFYEQDITSVARLKVIRNSVQYLLNSKGVIAKVYVRGIFKEVKTRELIFLRSWTLVHLIGTVNISLIVDGQSLICYPIEAFDVHIEEAYG